MGRKLGLTSADVVAAATTIADRDGLEAATLTAVADELGIKTPSLYNHVAGLSGLRRLLAMHGADILFEWFEQAADGLEGRVALRAIADANRRFELKHPGLSESFLPAPRPGEDEELYERMARPVGQISGILSDMGIPESEAIHLIRAFRSLVHGFLDLERKDGFGMPVDIDRSFEVGVEMVIAGIEKTAEAGERQP